MKKLLLPFTISILTLISLFIWINSSKQELLLIEKIQYLVILLLVVFGISIGIGRIKSHSRNEPIDDEMTKLVLMKSSSVSFFLSLFIWIIILILKDRYVYDTEIWIGTGILTMSCVFVFSFFIIKLRGTRQ